MHKICNKCREPIYMQDHTSTCMNCGNHINSIEFSKSEWKYKILWFAKIKGTNNFHVRMKHELKKMGHEVTFIHSDEALQFVQSYELLEVQNNHKPISLKPFEYKYNPDVIMVDQTYRVFKNDCENTAWVVYRQREFTHFPDMLNPDVLYQGYPMRNEVFKMYYPYEYSKINIKGNLFCAVDPELFPVPNQEKSFKGLQDIGWNVKYWQLATCNGPFAKVFIEEQERFSRECRKEGLVNSWEAPIDFDKYREILRNSSAILIDGGYYGWLTRRIFEAAASKTLMVIRIYSPEQLGFYGEIGLNDKAMFINCIEDIEALPLKIETEVRYNKIVEKAYKWVMENHTYRHRAEQLVEDLNLW